MSDDAATNLGAGLLPSDLTEHQLNDAPSLVSLNDLLIDELTDAGANVFAAALESRQ